MARASLKERQAKRAIEWAARVQASGFTTYGIVDPHPGKFVYVGQTAHLERRKRGHLRIREHKPYRGVPNIETWMWDIVTEGLEPSFITLEITETIEQSLASEDYWVKRLASDGHSLINKLREHHDVIKAAVF